MDITDLLGVVLERGASDLHISVGAAPVIRVHGELEPLDLPALAVNDTRELIYGILSQDQRQRLENDLELDFSYSLPGRARFRVNAYFQRNSMGAVFRLIPVTIPKLEDLGLPAILHDFAAKPRGFVVVTGPTGCGKSTTLAAMIDEINETRRKHIMTIEDPIEFLHRHKKSLVNQREVGPDTHSFARALKSVLRQDPDIILVGEMRDAETMSTALTAAETGHLVFATLHTQDASQTIDRIIDVFPPGEQGQIRTQLSTTLMGVCTQQLLPTQDGRGRAVACEVLVATPAVRNLIRQAQTAQLLTAIQTGGREGGRVQSHGLFTGRAGPQRPDLREGRARALYGRRRVPTAARPAPEGDSRRPIVALSGTRVAGAGRRSLLDW